MDTAKKHFDEHSVSYPPATAAYCLSGAPSHSFGRYPDQGAPKSIRRRRIFEVYHRLRFRSLGSYATTGQIDQPPPRDALHANRFLCQQSHLPMLALSGSVQNVVSAQQPPVYIPPLPRMNPHFANKWARVFGRTSRD